MKRFLYLFLGIFLLGGSIAHAENVSINWQYKTGGAIWGASATQNGVSFVGSGDGKLYAINSADGSLKWTFATDGAIYSGVRLAENALYFSSDDGHVYKLSQADGTLIWKANIHIDEAKKRTALDADCCTWDYRGSTPALNAGSIYVGSADGNLYALNAQNGGIRWSYKTKKQVNSSPAIADGKIVFGSFDGSVNALNLDDGSLVWKVKTYLPISSSPAIHKGVVYIGGRNTKLMALSLADGAVIWEKLYNDGSWVESSATIFDDILYIGSSDLSKTMSLNIETGAENWAVKPMKGLDVAQPLVTQTAVYQGIFGYDSKFQPKAGMVKIDRISGELIWKLAMPDIVDFTGHGVTATPEYANDAILFGALTGVFYSLKP